MKASLYLVLATLFWSGNFIVAQVAVASMTPLDLTFWRWTLAAVPLVLLAHFVEKPDWRAVLRRWPVLLLLSVLGMSGYTLLLYGALGHTSAMNASLITAANPALIVVLAMVLTGERTTRRGWFGIVLGLLGVLLVLTRGELQRVVSLSLNIGEVMMIGAILVWGCYTIIARRLDVPAITATATQVVIAGVTLAPFAVAADVRLPQTQAEAWSLAYIVVFPSLGAYLLWNLALKTTAPGTAGNYLNLIVVFTAVITVVLGTPLTIVQVAGGLLVVAGVLLTGTKPRAKSPADTLPASTVPAPPAPAPAAPAASGPTPTRRHTP
ncbi:DMT family transporter [Arthrobacter sp. U41]|uniref:DMT family transporter n=1 Tax=Arthrobacter sp. U41 TaxID=1849032 RepID=UPI0011AABE9C|nr:DMT family transporter [Arthrobacter sp. U41]